MLYFCNQIKDVTDLEVTTNLHFNLFLFSNLEMHNYVSNLGSPFLYSVRLRITAKNRIDK